MAVSAGPEARLALSGALLLARGDPRGLGYFDTSLAGFWRSFRAALVCYPFYLLLLLFRVTVVQWTAAGGMRIVIVETIAYVISWVAFPLIVLSLSRRIDRDDHFLGFMTVYNWSQVLQTGLFVVIALAGAVGLLPAKIGGPVGLAAAIAVLVYEWYIARIALDVPAPMAAIVVLLDLALATMLSRVTEALY